MFQHTAARRRLGFECVGGFGFVVVSTHSRPKAAGAVCILYAVAEFVSTHSRPKAAGWHDSAGRLGLAVSTHSRPKAAGPCPVQTLPQRAGFNTQPPEGGWALGRGFGGGGRVSTHSRPKAAGPLVRGKRSNC